MNKWLKRLSNWFFQIENEVMIPFVLVGILVIGSFSVISYYNGYTMQKNSEMELADTLFEDVNRDLHLLIQQNVAVLFPCSTFWKSVCRRRRSRKNTGILSAGGSGFWIVTVRRSRLEPVGKTHRYWQSARGTIHLAGGWSTG